MAKPNDLDLQADEIVDAAIVILRERGLDAVALEQRVVSALTIMPKT